MIKASIAIILLLLIVATHTDQEVPLRKDSYGFSIGDTKGNLQIQFFIDLLCPDSKASYNTLIDVMKSVDFYQQGIKFTYQFSPLSWHFYAFKIHQAFFYILQNSGSQQTQKFISYLFANQDKFAEQKWLDKTVSQFLDAFVQQISGVIKVDKAGLRAELNDGPTWNTARYHWKYTVGMNFVPGAPLFNLNSVRVDGAQNYTASEWIALIKQYKKNLSVKHLSVDDFYSNMMDGK